MNPGRAGWSFEEEHAQAELEVVLHDGKDVIGARRVRVESTGVVSLKQSGLSDHDGLLVRLVS